MALSFKRYLIKVRGGQYYLPVSARLIWFREEHPDWSVETQPLQIDLEKRIAVFQAVVKDAAGRIIATGTKMETGSDFNDYLEKAETGSVGRALAVCGYGTQFAPELSEGDVAGEGPVAYADSPQPIRGEEAVVPAEAMVCADCGTSLRQAQYTISMAKFQRPLCPACQRKATPDAAKAS
jgi:hypothetical protein